MSKTSKKLEKYTYITFSINNEKQIDDVIEILPDFKFYAYIFHDKDKDDDGNLKKKHLHCFIRNHPLTLSAWSNKLGIPENMLEIPRSYRACARYLIHADQPDKYQYDINQVVSNDLDYYKTKYFDEKISIEEQFNDFLALRQGRMTPIDFMKKYRHEFANVGFVQRLKGFDYITNNYLKDQRRVV